MQFRSALAALAFLAAFGAAADAYPAKPIHVIVPYAPGGVVDVQTRAIKQRMAVELGQPIVVEAKPGANGDIGAGRLHGAGVGALPHQQPAAGRQAALGAEGLHAGGPLLALAELLRGAGLLAREDGEGVRRDGEEVAQAAAVRRRRRRQHAEHPR